MAEWSLIPNSVAAVATSAAAVAAWRSARASQRTSLDAQRALAVGIAPSLTVNAIRGGDPDVERLSELFSEEGDNDVGIDGVTSLLR